MITLEHVTKRWPNGSVAVDDLNLEVGAGLGPLAGKIWRVGLMGASSSARLVTLLLASLQRTPIGATVGRPS